jgi:hypothetical protein
MVTISDHPTQNLPIFQKFEEYKLDEIRNSTI